MTLRDQHGEIEVGIGDLFAVKDCIFSVVCPESIYRNNSPIWVRLISGVLDYEGMRYEVSPEAAAALKFPVLLFTAELLADLVREHRLMTFDIPAPAVPAKAKPAAEPRRAPASKKPAPKHDPTQKTLF